MFGLGVGVSRGSRTCPKYVWSIPGNRLSMRSGRGVAAPGGVEEVEPIWSRPSSSDGLLLRSGGGLASCSGAMAG